MKRPEDMTDTEWEARKQDLEMIDKEYEAKMEAARKRLRDLSDEKLMAELEDERENRRITEIRVQCEIMSLEGELAQCMSRCAELEYEFLTRIVRAGLRGEDGAQVRSLVVQLAKLPGGVERWLGWMAQMGSPPNTWSKSLRDALTNPDTSLNTSFFEALVPDHASLTNRALADRLEEMGVKMSYNTVRSYFPSSK